MLWNIVVPHLEIYSRTRSITLILNSWGGCFRTPFFVRSALFGLLSHNCLLIFYSSPVSSRYTLFFTSICPTVPFFHPLFSLSTSPHLVCFTSSNRTFFALSSFELISVSCGCYLPLHPCGTSLLPSVRCIHLNSSCVCSGLLHTPCALLLRLAPRCACCCRLLRCLYSWCQLLLQALSRIAHLASVTLHCAVGFLGSNTWELASPSAVGLCYTLRSLPLCYYLSLSLTHGSFNWHFHFPLCCDISIARCSLRLRDAFVGFGPASAWRPSAPMPSNLLAIC